MEFDGTAELAAATAEEAWLALSDPVVLERALPGCRFVSEVDEGSVDFDALRERESGRPPLAEASPDEVASRAIAEGSRYAALLELSVGSVSPSFEAVGTIERREFPEMTAVGGGHADEGEFEAHSSMTVTETADGAAIEWHAEADVFGRLAGMGQRVLDPVAGRVVQRFFANVEDELAAAERGDVPLSDHVRALEERDHDRDR